MNLEELASNYILKTRRVLIELRIVEGSMHTDLEGVKRVIEEAKRYFEDAKYYLDRKKFEISLASIAYCEGLLDALRMLRFVEFSW